MNTEIEIKAWVDNPHDIEVRLKTAGAEYVREYHKRDTYYYRRDESGQLEEFRLRFDGNESIVTHKEKHLSNGLENNSEREFTVSSADNFIHLMKVSGYVSYIEKDKKGKAYIIQDLLVEVSQIKHLGTFIEIEQVLEHEPAEKEVAAIEKKIRSVLESLDIDDSRIESESYTKMIADKLGITHPRKKKDRDS